jgi:predicted SprT family Zn-dependent metalloprotease
MEYTRNAIGWWPKTTFESRIICEGTEVSNTPEKILFRQKFNQCWVKKSDIRLNETLGHLDGEKVIRIVVPEEVANTLELEGILD